MATIYQSIEILSKEKGIDPQIVIDAVKDAMLVAARKHFRTVEDLVAEFNDHTGALEIFAVKRVVPEVQDAVNELTLDQALHAITLGAAYTLKLDHQIGSLEIGKFADFAVLEEDPLSIDPTRLKDIRVWGTVVAGQVFEAPGQDQ